MDRIVNIINDVVWSPALVILLVAAGLYFTIRTRCVQVRRIRMMTHFLFSRKRNPGPRKEKTILSIYQTTMLCLVVVGAVTASDTVWKMGDIGVGLTAWINVIALLILFPQALALLKDYENNLHRT